MQPHASALAGAVSAAMVDSVTVNASAVVNALALAVYEALVVVVFTAAGRFVNAKSLIPAADAANIRSIVISASRVESNADEKESSCIVAFSAVQSAVFRDLCEVLAETLRRRWPVGSDQLRRGSAAARAAAFTIALANAEVHSAFDLAKDLASDVTECVANLISATMDEFLCPPSFPPQSQDARLLKGAREDALDDVVWAAHSAIHRALCDVVIAIGTDPGFWVGGGPQSLGAYNTYSTPASYHNVAFAVALATADVRWALALASQISWDVAACVDNRISAAKDTFWNPAAGTDQGDTSEDDHKSEDDHERESKDEHESAEDKFLNPAPLRAANETEPTLVDLKKVLADAGALGFGTALVVANPDASALNPKSAEDKSPFAAVDLKAVARAAATAANSAAASAKILATASAVAMALSESLVLAETTALSAAEGDASEGRVAMCETLAMVESFAKNVRDATRNCQGLADEVYRLGCYDGVFLAYDLCPEAFSLDTSEEWDRCISRFLWGAPLVARDAAENKEHVATVEEVHMSPCKGTKRRFAADPSEPAALEAAKSRRLI